jgi:hypothetical protein
MSNDAERKEILGMIASGKITAAEGLNLLKAIEEEQEAGKELPLTDLAFESQREDLPTEPKPEPGEGGLASPAPAQPGTPNEPLDQTASASAGTTRSFPTAETTVQAANPIEPATGEVIAPTSVPDLDVQKWKRWWQIPLWIGVGITLLGALLMYLAWRGSGFGFWFACTWFPFLAGVTLLALAWSSRTMRWMHIRIQQETGEWPRTMAISLPLPFGWIRWFIKAFGPWIPGLTDAGLDEVMTTLEKNPRDTPFYVDVNEGENGERVQIFIG